MAALNALSVGSALMGPYRAWAMPALLQLLAKRGDAAPKEAP